MSFITLRIDTDPKLNFWDLNPHIRFIPGYSKLYDEDKSKDKAESSKVMWCITWLCHPDEEVNRYYRLSESDKLETCKKFNPKFNEEDELTKQCIERFPDDCLNVIEKALKGELDFLNKRSQFLRNAEYNYDTMTPLDNAVSKTSKIMEQFDLVYQKYVESKKKTIQLIGGRNQTAREKNRIKPSLIETE